MAIDKASNVEMSTCSTMVGKGQLTENDPHFLIGKLELVGGIDP